jgi:hypothetical protein
MIDVPEIPPRTEKTICTFCDQPIKETDFPHYIRMKPCKEFAYHPVCALDKHKLLCEWLMMAGHLTCEVTDQLKWRVFEPPIGEPESYCTFCTSKATWVIGKRLKACDQHKEDIGPMI